MKTHFVRAELIPCRQTDGQTESWTDRQDEANSRFSQVLGRA